MSEEIKTTIEDTADVSKENAENTAVNKTEENAETEVKTETEATTEAAEKTASEDKTEGEVKTEEASKEVDEETAKKNKRKAIIKELFSWVMVVVVAFLLAYVITHYVIIKAEVPTGSMETTIMTDDQLIGNRLAYLFSDPQHGDIVIFYNPDDESELYIKRIIGIPGDEIQVVDGVVYRNGEALVEPYLHEAMDVNTTKVYKVPEGHYFMMGDNRNHSWDSRKWGNTYVAREKILGKAWLRYAPSWGFVK